MDYKDLARKWFDKGNDDLRAGEYILTMPDPPTDTICFHSRQAVEIRYPLESDYEITYEEAQLTLGMAKKFKKIILNKL